ncbi:eukaryotic translation elongation factor 1 delta b (guanine nucleotide exchange protein) isoform X4 [Gasterosteus aculeatus]
MMTTKIPQCSALDRPEPDQPPSRGQVDRSANAAPGCKSKAECPQRNGEGASSSPESSNLNGEGKRSGKSRRRKKRSSNAAAGRPDEKGDVKIKDEEKPDKRTGPPAELMGLQSECASVWLDRSAYERAESLYQGWLASFSVGAAKSNRLPAAPGKNSQSAAAPPAPGSLCRHSEPAACHHAVQGKKAVPKSLDLPASAKRSGASRTPDEGYQSSAPTPATPVIQPASVSPTNRQSVNGLPRLPVELLRDVWLEKPLYDRAEAAFYQNLYGNNSSKRASCTSTSRSTDHPQSLVEEEEEGEEDGELAPEEEKRAVPQGKAEVFHALLPIQEEEEPSEVPEKAEAPAAGVRHFVHPDSERVWLDKWRYDAAESRFHGHSESGAVVGKKGRRPEAASTAPLRDNDMTSMDFLATEKIWFDKPRYDEAERRFYERPSGCSQAAQDVGSNTILQDIARARENIQKSLAGSISAAADQGEIICRIKSLELENHSLRKVVDDLRAALSKLDCRVSLLEKSPAAVAAAPAAAHTNGTAVQQKTSVPVKDEEEDSDIDLFGSDDDEEAAQLKEKRLKEYAEKKAKKPGIIAKSSILLDVKPWDDETDMVKLEECVRSVVADGLLWGTSKLVPVGYGIKKLQIACVVEDDKVGTDLLEEEITKFEDYIQSVDVAAFNKI